MPMSKITELPRGMPTIVSGRRHTCDSSPGSTERKGLVGRAARVLSLLLSLLLSLRRRRGLWFLLGPNEI